MLGTEGSVHKWKENLYHVDGDFRQLEKQSKSDCRRWQSSEICSTCTDFGISTSVYMVQGHPVTIQSLLLVWKKVSNAGLGGKEETAWQAGSGTTCLIPTPQPSSTLGAEMDRLQGWHLQPACSSPDTPCGGAALPQPPSFSLKVTVYNWSPGALEWNSSFKWTHQELSRTSQL